MEKFIDAQIQGLEQLQRALLQEPPEKARKTLREALEVGGNVFKAAVWREAPKLTGFLAEHFNIKFSFRGSTATDPHATAFIGPDGKMDYPLRGGGYKRRGNRKIGRIKVISVARFDEFGTSKQRANPFMTRAFETAKAEALSRVIAAIKMGLGIT